MCKEDIQNSIFVLNLKFKWPLVRSDTGKTRPSLLYCAIVLILSGDIHSNQGPTYPCLLCNRPVANNRRAVLCDSCEEWVDIACNSIHSKTYEQFLYDKILSWECPNCILPNISNISSLSISSRYNSIELLDRIDSENLTTHNRPKSHRP